MFPVLTEMLSSLASDNDMSLRSVKRWDEAQAKVTYRFAEIESQAEKLSEEERYSLVCGEFTEVNNLVEQHGLRNLNDFLNDCFDGELHHCFFCLGVVNGVEVDA